MLHVQRDLLSLGVDSAVMTTDSGIDLVAYDSQSKKSFSIQVKTSGMVLSVKRPDWKVKKNKLDDAELFAFVLKNQIGEAWYLTGIELRTGSLLRLYNGEWALTFYRTGAPKGRTTESDMAPYKGLGGLERFLVSLRSAGGVLKVKAAGA